MTDPTVSNALQFFSDSVFLQTFCTCVLKDREPRKSSSSSSSSSDSSRNSNRGQERASVPDGTSVERWRRMLAFTPAVSGLKEQQLRNAARAMSVLDFETRLQREIPGYDAFLQTIRREFQKQQQSGPLSLDEDTQVGHPATIAFVGRGNEGIPIKKLSTSHPKVECVDDSFFVSESLDKPLRVHTSNSGSGNSKSVANKESTPTPTLPPKTAPAPVPVQQGPQLFTPQMFQSTRIAGGQGFTAAPAGDMAAATKPIDLDAGQAPAALKPTPNSQGMRTFTKEDMMAMNLQVAAAAAPPAASQEELTDLDAFEDL